MRRSESVQTVFAVFLSFRIRVYLFRKAMDAKFGICANSVRLHIHLSFKISFDLSATPATPVPRPTWTGLLERVEWGLQSKFILLFSAVHMPSKP